MLSPTSSIDCFSDTELDIDGPPVIRNNKIDENPDIPVYVEKTGSKVESLAETKISSTTASLNETRDVDYNMSDEVELEQPRDLVDDVIDDETAEEPIAFEKTSTNPDSCDVINPCVTSESSIRANRSQVTIAPKETMESVEAINKMENAVKSFDSVNWPIAASKTSSSHKSAAIPASSTAEQSIRINSSEPTELVEELTVLKKPTVSFADEVSQSDHATIETKGSSSSKKSVKSRMSLFSMRKSKDSASISKSLKSNKSGKPPMAPLRVEPSVVDKVDANDNVCEDKSIRSVGLASDEGVTPEERNDTTVDDDRRSVTPESADISTEANMVSAENIVPPPPQPLQVRQNSTKTNKSKGTVKSSKSNVVVPSLATKASSSFDKPKKKESSSVSTPKLFGPPQHLPQWSGISKSGKSVASKRSVADHPENEPTIDHLGDNNESNTASQHDIDLKTSSVAETTPKNEAVVPLTNVEEDVPTVKFNVGENILSPPQSPSVVGPPGRLPVSVSNKSVPSKHDEEAVLDDEVIGEHLLDATSTLSSKSSKEDDIEEASETAHSKRTASSKRSTTEVLATEQILNTSAAEEAEVKDENVSKQLTIAVNDIESDPIQAVMQPFSPIQVPVCVSEEDVILKNDKVTSSKNENDISDSRCDVPMPKASELKKPKMEIEKQHNGNSLFRMFSKANAVKVSKASMDSAVVVRVEDKKKVAAPAPKVTKAVSKLLSPKKSSLVEKGTSIEVLATPSKSTSKNFGIFKRNPSKKSAGTTSPEPILDTAHVNFSPSLVPFTSVPVDCSTNSATSITKAPASETMEKLVVDFSDNNLPMHEKEVVAVKEVIKPKSNKNRKSILFGRTKTSNETKRQIAKKFQTMSRKDAPKKKELGVKLSAKIDETIVVENLRVTRSYSSPFEQNKSAGKVPLNLKDGRDTKALQTTKSKKMEDKLAPIIVVDHRSSKKIEAFGRFENKTPNEIESKSQRNIPELFLSNIKMSSNSADDNRLYTSDDTVTETELTRVAKLDVPLEPETAKSISDPMKMSEDIVDVSTIIKNDIEASNNDRSKTEPTWVANFVDWCTPKSSTTIHKWINCAGQEVPVNVSASDHRAIETTAIGTTYKQYESNVTDEVISEFNECHAFYADSFTLKAKVKPEVPVNMSASDHRAIEITTKQYESKVLDEVISEFNECHEFYADTLNLKTKAKPDDLETHPVTATSDWGTQFMEWMSPKSRQVVLETSEQEMGKTKESTWEKDEAKTNIAEDVTMEIDVHEGTELALTNFERSPEKQAKRPGYYSFRGILRKSLRTPFKKVKQGLPLSDRTVHKNEKLVEKVTTDAVNCNAKKIAFPVRHFFRNKPNLASKSKKKEELTEIVSDEAPVVPTITGKLVVIEEAESNPSPKVQLLQVDHPTAALFTFTSDDGMSDVQGPKPAEALTEFLTEHGQVQTLDEDIESTVHYLEIVKSKRQSRKQKVENEQVEAWSKVSDELAGRAKDNIGDLVNEKPAVNEENVANNEKDEEYQYRVNAVSDEVVEDMRSSLSDTTSSMVGDSFLSFKDDKLEVEEKSAATNVEKKAVQSKPTAPARTKKGMPSTKAARFLSRRKDEDSVGVSLNSDINSFNDDLSVAFAPAVGKWLW